MPTWQDLRDADVAKRFAARRPPVAPKTPGQQRYLDALLSSPLTLVRGSPGTGKTLLACLAAARLLKEGVVDRITLTRPLVSCGEDVGHLPGELADKTAPYRAVLEEAFGAVLGEDVAAMTRAGHLHFAPLGFLRGATFRRTFVILDEAQNTSPVQMRMFLTRAGDDARLVVCGDPEQLDVRGPSGFLDALAMFAAYPLAGVAVVELGEADVMRGGLVREVERRYKKWNEIPPIPSYGRTLAGRRGV